MADVKAPAAETAAANGQAPASGGEECADCATASERAMGIAGLLFAAFLAGIAIDLISGGRLSRLIVGAFGREGGEGGQPGAG